MSYIWAFWHSHKPSLIFCYVSHLSFFPYCSWSHISLPLSLVSHLIQFIFIYSFGLHLTGGEEKNWEGDQRHDPQDDHHGDTNSLPIPRRSSRAAKVLLKKQNQSNRINFPPSYTVSPPLRENVLVLPHLHCLRAGISCETCVSVQQPSWEERKDFTLTEICVI